MLKNNTKLNYLISIIAVFSVALIVYMIVFQGSADVNAGFYLTYLTMIVLILAFAYVLMKVTFLMDPQRKGKQDNFTVDELAEDQDTHERKH